MDHCYINLKQIMDKLESMSMAYESLSLKAQLEILYQRAFFQENFLSLSDIYIHGEKDLPCVSFLLLYAVV